jgi:hypothetical protein
MRPSELREIIQLLDAGGPIYMRLQDDLRSGSGKSRAWYTSQKQHWLGWLSGYNGPGAYGRAHWANRSAQFVYNHLQCVPALVWLAEALGVTSQTLIAACEEVKNSGIRASAQCGAFRRAVPWTMIEAQLVNSRKPPSAQSARRKSADGLERAAAPRM